MSVEFLEDRDVFRDPRLLISLGQAVSSITDPKRKARLQHSRTLILNRDYRPVSLLPVSAQGWQDAIINMLCKDNIEPIAFYPDDVSIRSTNCEFRIPSVAVSKQYIKHKRRVQFMRANIFLRDDHTCQYCGNRFAPVDLTFDHLVPRSLGGKTTWENIVTSCHRCNGMKGSRPISKWKSPLGLNRPLKHPVKPTYESLENVIRKGPLMIPSEDWVDYLQWQGPLWINDGVDVIQVQGEENPYVLDELGF